MKTLPHPALPNARPPATTREFLAVVFRRRWLILGLFAVTTATVFTIAFSTPTVYVSSGRVMVKRGEQVSLLIPTRNIMNDWEADLANEVETARSYPVMQRARELLEARARAGQPRTPFEPKQLDAEVMGKSNVLAIGYGDRDPDVAQRACDAAIQAYIDYRQGSLLSYPSRFFERELEQATAGLREWSEKRRQYANANGVVDVGEQKRQHISQLAVLSQLRTEMQAELAQARAEQRIMAELQRNPEVDMPAIGAPSVNESALNDVKNHIIQQENRIATLRERYREESGEVRNALVTLNTLREMLRREVDNRLRLSRSRVELVESRLAVVNRDMGVLEARLRAVPDQEAAIAEMDRQIAAYKTRLAELQEKSDQTRINENTTPAVTVYLLNPAGAPLPRNSRDYVRLALAPAFSLVVGIGLAFFVDGLDLTVHTAGQAEEEIDVPVLASITERRRSV